jgi:hypothetical protein
MGTPRGLLYLRMTFSEVLESLMEWEDAVFIMKNTTRMCWRTSVHPCTCTTSKGIIAERAYHVMLMLGRSLRKTLSHVG